MKLRAEHWVVLGSVVALFAGALLAVRRPRGLGRDPEDALRGSTHYTSPSGGKAFYSLLRDLGRGASRHSRKTELLADDVRLLLILGPSRPVTNEEAASLAGWVTEGGSILWCPRAGGGTDEPLLSAFGLAVASGSRDETSDVLATLEPVGGVAGVRYALSVTGERRLTGGEAEVLAEDAGGWVAVVIRKGQGRFIAFSEPRVFSNQGLARAAHAEFAVHLAILAAGKGRIAFDEYHHGFKEGQGALALVQETSLFPALLLGGAAVFLGLLASNRRLGPPIRTRRGERRRPAEFIEAFAGLCRRQRAARQIRAILEGEFRLFLRQHGESAGAQAVLDRRSDEGSLVRWCRELEEARRAILKKGALRVSR